MKRLVLVVTALSLLAAWSASVVEASLIVGDGFAYANGALAGNNGGTNGNPPTDQWTAAWAGSGTVSSGQASIGFSSVGNRQITTSFVGSAVAPLYFSGLFTKTGADTTYALWLRLDSDTNDSNSVATIGLANNNYSVRLQGGVEASHDFGTYTPGDQVQIVGKLEFNVSGANERLQIWVNPTGVETGLIVSNQLLQDVGWTTPSFAHLRNFVGDGGSYLIDDVRIGTTWASVVPEPSSFVMLLFGSLSMWLMRRKRSV